MTFALGIPTLVRYDCLAACVRSAFAGTAKPDRLLIVDNGCKLRPETLPVPGHFHREPGRLVVLLSPDRGPPHYGNMGVAASWNLLHRQAGPEPLVVCNDDVLFAPGTLQAMVGSAGEFVTGFPPSAFACFLAREPVWQKVGPFDEQFWPAYWEDIDYIRRMELAGIPITHAQPQVKHLASATRKALPPAMKRDLDRHTGLNRKRFEQKWPGK